MTIHKEGHKILRNQIIIYFILALITLCNKIFLYYITPIFLTTFLSSLYFFRVPKRNITQKDGIIYAPCDGKIVVIEKTLEKEYYNEDKIQISIFMSPLNAHNNLYPISGDITYAKYHPGKFFFAWKPKASTDNEMSTVIIKNERISLLVKQIAGALARRIITYAKIGDNINAGQELGFIKFGSRVDLFLPLNSNIKIKLHQKTKAGKTIIATF